MFEKKQEKTADNNHYHLAQVGTYDIESLGDTMFPKAFQFGLSKYIDSDCFDVDLYSLNECEHPYNGLSHVYSLKEFTENNNKNPYDALIIGGGEFLSFAKIEFFLNGEKIYYPEGWLWRNTISEAKNAGVKVIINCVGMPLDITEKQQEIIRDSLSYADIITVRDEFSRARLVAAGLGEKVKTVPDNLWYFNQMYTKEALNDVREDLEQASGIDLHTPYLTVQYGTSKDYDALITSIKKIQEKYDNRILLIPVNYTHEDLEFCKQLNNKAEHAFIVVDYYMQPLQIMSLIAGAKGFIGTSFHGNLISASYGVPFVGIDMYPGTVSKMDGLFSMLDSEELLCPKEEGLSATFDDSVNKMENTDFILIIDKLQHQLDEHYQKIAEDITK